MLEAGGRVRSTRRQFSHCTTTLVGAAMHSRSPSLRLFHRLASCLLVGIASSRATAQCATQWSPGDGIPGTNGPVTATTLWDPDGPGPRQPVVVVCGEFTVAGAVPATRIAAYDPASGIWSALGAGLNNYSRALVTLPNGDLVVGGAFSTAGGVPTNGIARWNGTSWSAFGTGLSGYGGVNALTTLRNGDLVAGGTFTTAGGVSANHIARWNGMSWSALGTGMSSYGVVNALTTLPNGDLVAGGPSVMVGGVFLPNIARWDGTSWSALGTGTSSYGSVNALMVMPNGGLVAGGEFTTVGGVAANCVARWSGTSWSALGTGTNDAVLALTTLPNGDLVAGGQFATAGGVPANHIARWNGTSWSALGVGMTGPGGPGVAALTTLPNGDLVAGGWFASAGGARANHVARWNGASWSALGTGMDVPVHALTTLANGDLVAGGPFTTLGSVFLINIARWDGTSWSALGTGVLGYVNALTTLPNGDLVAGGSLPSVGGVAVNGIARWNGSSWSAFGAGMGGSVQGNVLALTTLPNGDVAVGGDFTTAGGLVSAYVARLTTTCPAFATTLGTGCNSSVGPMVLTATSLPWIGGTFRSTCTGITPTAFAFGLFGFTSPGTALSLLHPAGGIGCSLLASPDGVLLLRPTAGSVTNQLALPLDPAFVGVVLHNQVLQVEVDPLLHITRIGSSNGITLTVGVF